MLVCETAEKTFELPGLTLTSEKNALESLRGLIEKLDVTGQPQQTLYLSHFTMEEEQKKPITVMVRIVHLEAVKVSSSLDGHFHSLAKLQVQPQASSLVRTVTKWISDQ